MKHPLFIVLLFFINSTLAIAQVEKLQSGPMVGYSEMKEVMLWVQTKTSAKVKFGYYPGDSIKQRKFTEEITTGKDQAFVAKLVADQVLPGKKYTYELYIDGKLVKRDYPLSFQTQALWQYRTDPPNFRIATGSCMYINEPAFDRPGEAYGAGYEILKSISDKKPDLMLWLGDNIYLREADWGSRTGILYRNTHSRSLPELQPLLGSTHNYAIWDDHDFGPNDSDKSFVNKDLTTEAFKLFWANPNYGTYNGKGIYGSFVWGDVEFFLLDNRSFRDANSLIVGKKDYFGKEQLDWLFNALATSRATFKIIATGGQILNPAAVYENYATYPEEREYFLKSLQANNIKGVLFLTGDRHTTDLTKLNRYGTYPLYDLTVSPLTSGPGKSKDTGMAPNLGKRACKNNHCSAS
ncbi:MAG: alkaline phosphatase family protein, partial [Cytophagales bacterium]|nr:alkaline phosphatase family protein [Cytophagales bacterium]